MSHVRWIKPQFLQNKIYINECIKLFHILLVTIRFFKAAGARVARTVPIRGALSPPSLSESPSPPWTSILPAAWMCPRWLSGGKCQSSQRKSASCLHKSWWSNAPRNNFEFWHSLIQMFFLEGCTQRVSDCTVNGKMHVSMSYSHKFLFSWLTVIFTIRLSQ